MGYVPDNNEETVIVALDDCLDLATSVENGLGAAEGEGKLLGEDLGRDEGPDGLDAAVVEEVVGLVVRLGVFVLEKSAGKCYSPHAPW